MNDKADMLRSLKIDRSADEQAQVAQGRRGVSGLVLGAAIAATALSAGGLAWVLKPAPDAPSPPPSSTSAAPGGAAILPAGGLTASGYVVARRRATVAAEVTGRVLEVRVEEGQSVKEGDVLAVLDASLARADYQASRSRILTAQAGVTAAEAELAEGRRVLARQEALAPKGFASDAGLKNAQARVETLAANLAQARAQLSAARAEASRAGAQLARYEIRAPFSGVVIDKAAQPGEIISPVSAGGGFTRTGICTLVDMDSLEIEVDVNEANIARVKPGQKVEAVLDAYPDLVLPGSVIATIPAASRDKATVRVRVAFDQRDPRILPDMAIKVTFIESRQ